MASNSSLFRPLGRQLPSTLGAEKISDIDPRLTRTHYFDGRLLTAEDLNRDQIYLDQRLREVGQTLGRGVVRGLDLSFDDASGQLSVTPGMAVTAAGRVLDLKRPLSVDLGARARIAELNAGRNRRFNRGLYAAVLRYTEVGSDIAEVFPTDLGERRGAQFDVIAESVQLGLIPLPQPLPVQNPLHIRANLIREFLGDGQLTGLIPDDAVALGVLAIRDDRPVWLDANLLRQPLRGSPRPGDLQSDLARHYEALYADVLDYRRSGALGMDFAASEYFRILPPVGSLPKGAIDPMNGRQGFFPESYRVWIAPIRLADLELVRRESMTLPPMDLSLDEPVDVVALAPLANSDYGFFARRLERPGDAATRRLAHLDLLKLRLYPRRPVHELDTDEAAWQAIWDRITAESIVYIRRPTRAAETTISGIVLALGTDLPTAPTAPAPTPADGGLLQDEDAAFLNRVNLDQLRVQRPPADPAGDGAHAQLVTAFGDDANVVQSVLNILLRVERRYDPVVWQTLLPLAQTDSLGALLQSLIDGQSATTTTAQVVVAAGAALGLSTGLLNEWTALDAG